MASLQEIKIDYTHPILCHCYTTSSTKTRGESRTKLYSLIARLFQLIGKTAGSFKTFIWQDLLETVLQKCAVQKNLNILQK